MSWLEGRPIYDRLPGRTAQSYRKDRDDPDYDPSTDVALWLTEYWDGLLVEKKDQILNFEADYLDPLTARSDALDWLAQFAGYTGPYWDSQWLESAKRQLINRAYEYVWQNKGTTQLLEWLIEIFELDATIYSPGEFLADVNEAEDELGGEAFYYLILVDFFTANYLRTSPQWDLLEKLNELFGCVYCESRVAYSDFIADFSIVDDPVFEGEITDEEISYDLTLTGNQTFASIVQVASPGTSISVDIPETLIGSPCRMDVYIGVITNPANQVASLTFPSSYLGQRFRVVHDGISYANEVNIVIDGDRQVY